MLKNLLVGNNACGYREVKGLCYVAVLNNKDETKALTDQNYRELILHVNSQHVNTVESQVLEPLIALQAF